MTTREDLIKEIDELGRQLFHDISFEENTVEGSYDAEDYLSKATISITIPQAKFILKILKHKYKQLKS